ncbi:act minimal PKS acyl carrier protein [Amycolatopsis arida]|uniref:Act minimal PKS acyl carrier protein n=1 Tax=Amycolatopsis arida TaxID=587909 RepID=A0A1I6A8K4_9PSEU|nr:acyl carrier protein [Amycolatopsis arida]TDX88526.1 act minimal PKS acyl carrier protein [Amycolatopsis arida]SFQ64897.1 act minimal PKS acyl carrier protein [Amycolatopsis arida]
MTQFTADELREIMVRSAGEDESIDLDGPFLDTSFDDLGYDSLAVLDIAVQVQRAHGVALDEDDLPQMSTPRDVLDLVRSRQRTAGV